RACSDVADISPRHATPGGRDSSGPAQPSDDASLSSRPVLDPAGQSGPRPARELGQKFCDIEWPAGGRAGFAEASNEFQAPGCYSIRSTSFLFLPVTLAAFAATVRLFQLSSAGAAVASYMSSAARGSLRGFVTNGSTAFNYVISQVIAGATRREVG